MAGGDDFSDSGLNSNVQRLVLYSWCQEEKVFDKSLPQSRNLFDFALRYVNVLRILSVKHNKVITCCPQ